jgi:hypothetical protein
MRENLTGDLKSLVTIELRESYASFMFYIHAILFLIAVFNPENFILIR